MSEKPKSPARACPLSMAVFKKIARSATELFQVPVALIVLRDAAGDRVAACVGRVSGQEARQGPRLCGRIIDRNEPGIICGPANDEADPERREHRIQFFAAYPIRNAEGSAVGALALMDRRAHQFSAGDLSCLSDLTELLEQDVERLAADRARGRRVLNLPQTPSDDDVCVLMVDIDAPAGIDDALGSNAVDRVGLWARDRVSLIVRAGDVVSHLPQGGLLLFIRGGENGARRVAERIRLLLEGAPLALPLESGDR